MTLAAKDLPLQIMPLGGLGKIGMNCMLVGCEGRWVMVDCGVQFPPSNLIGAERLLPDLELVSEWRDRIEAVLITHGHEDHIGALPWVMPLLDPSTPIWASSFTTQLIKRRLEEYDLWKPERLRRLTVGERFGAGPFEVDAIRVTHSLPDCASLVLRGGGATIVHTGDWKIDEQPMDGEHFDREAFARLGDEGVSLLLSDSTNILSPGRTLSERSVADAIHARIAAWPGRVIVTQFSSNLHRLQGVAQAAAATGRKIALVGRSLSSYLDAAGRVGRVPIPADLLVSIDEVDGLPAHEVIIVTTGSQGESRAALIRAAAGAHPTLSIGRGDLVLHSARVIPGNEGEVYEMFNQLVRRGATLVTGKGTGIHASGHARADELLEMMSLLRPAHFIPVHGEHTFLAAHAELARTRSPIAETTVIGNGETFGFAPGDAPGIVSDFARVALTPLEPLYNDGPATGDYEAMKLGERKKVAWNGVVVVDVALNGATDGRLSGDARVVTRALWQDGGRLADRLEAAAEAAVEASEPDAGAEELSERVRVAVRSACRKIVGKRPEVLVTLHCGRVA